MELLIYVVVFVVLGGILYLLDERYGVEKYKAWWKFTHKDPLPEGSLVGFVCGRRTKDRIFPAACVVLVTCFVLRYLGEHDVIALLLKGTFLMFPGLLIGFLIAALVRKNPTFSPTVEVVLNTFDNVENGKVGINDVVSGIATEAKNIRGKVVDALHSASDSHTAPEVQQTSPKKEDQVPVVREKGKSFTQALHDYKSRG
jgi:hypothetical protein